MYLDLCLRKTQTYDTEGFSSNPGSELIRHCWLVHKPSQTCGDVFFQRQRIVGLSLITACICYGS